jgi:hypothetical protein
MEVGQGPNCGCSANEKKYQLICDGVNPIFCLRRRLVTSLEANCKAESQPELLEKFETKVFATGAFSKF